MPIYDYVCGACGARTEVIHGIDAPSPQFCPACGAEGRLRKAFVAPTVHFKGSGWAKKDRSTASRSRSKADDEPAGGDATDGTGKAAPKADGDTSGTGGDTKDASAGKDQAGSPGSGASSGTGDKGKGGSKASGSGKD